MDFNYFQEIIRIAAKCNDTYVIKIIFFELLNNPDLLGFLFSVRLYGRTFVNYYLEYLCECGDNKLLLPLISREELHQSILNNPYLFLLACKKDNDDVVRELLFIGVNPAMDDNLPLTEACFKNSVKVVKILISDYRVISDSTNNGAISNVVLNGKLYTEILDLFLNHPETKDITEYYSYFHFNEGEKEKADAALKRYHALCDKRIQEQRLRRTTKK